MSNSGLHPEQAGLPDPRALTAQRPKNGLKLGLDSSVIAVVRIAFAIVTSLLATATMTILWGMPRSFSRCATDFKTGF